MHSILNVVASSAANGPEPQVYPYIPLVITALVTLGAVAFGFYLGSLVERRKVTRKRKAINAELRTNEVLIPQKIDLLQKIVKELKHKKLLRSKSPRFPAYCYTNYIGDVSELLTNIERENLVIIYETFRIIDDFMDNLFSEYVKMYQSDKPLPDFQKSYIGDLKSLIKECELAKRLIEAYLKGKPIKIAWEDLPQWE